MLLRSFPHLSMVHVFAKADMSRTKKKISIALIRRIFFSNHRMTTVTHTYILIYSKAAKIEWSSILVKMMPVCGSMASWNGKLMKWIKTSSITTSTSWHTNNHVCVCVCVCGRMCVFVCEYVSGDIINAPR